MLPLVSVREAFDDEPLFDKDDVPLPLFELFTERFESEHPAFEASFMSDGASMF